jgi:hypothetical protein
MHDRVLNQLKVKPTNRDKLCSHPGLLAISRTKNKREGVR